MIGWLRALLDRWTGRSSEPPVPPPRPATPSVPGAPRVEYRDAPPPRPSVQVRYRRESIRVPRLGIESWSRRATPRQKVLVIGAVVSVLALTVSAAQHLTVNRTLPRTVHGYWITDTERYAGVAMELRAHLLAFKTTDSAQAVVIRRILEVSLSESPRGAFYRVVYDAEGEPAELRFTFEDGSTPEITFEHQPLVTWRRFSVNSTMLPQGF